MFILAKRNIILPSSDGSASIRVAKNYVGEIPDWAAETAYFSALVKDGKIVVTAKQDKAVQDAMDKPVKGRRGKAEE